MCALLFHNLNENVYFKSDFYKLMVELNETLAKNTSYKDSHPRSNLYGNKLFETIHGTNLSTKFDLFVETRQIVVDFNFILTVAL